MKITGAMLIGKSEVMGTHGSIRAFNPAADIYLDPKLWGRSRSGR
jgi:hypothetical protein